MEYITTLRVDNMAEVATQSAATPAAAGQSNSANTSKDKAPPTTRPERPDEEQYKTELGKAEKELKSAEERMVSHLFHGAKQGCSLYLLQDERRNLHKWLLMLLAESH